MTLKELRNNPRIEVTKFRNDGKWLVFSKTEPGIRAVQKYLCSIGRHNGAYFFVDGMKPRNLTRDIIQLEKDIKTYVASLPYDSEYYNPMYRKGIFEEHIIYDYMTSLGFKHADDDLFVLDKKNIYNYVSHEIKMSLSGYSCWGRKWSSEGLGEPTEDVKVILWTGDYSWTEVVVKRNVEDVKKAIDTTLKPLLVTDSVDNFTLAEKLLKSPEGIDITMNKMMGMGMKSESYREELKGKLKKVLAELE